MKKINGVFVCFINLLLISNFAIFVCQRKFLFTMKRPAVLEIHASLNGIDIFLFDNKSSTDIIFFHGSTISGVIYKKLLQDMSDKTNHNVLSFNMRGVFNSRGVPYEMKSIYFLIL